MTLREQQFSEYCGALVHTEICSLACSAAEMTNMEHTTVVIY